MDGSLFFSFLFFYLLFFLLRNRDRNRDVVYLLTIVAVDGVYFQ